MAVGVRIRPEQFGGVAYVSRRDDFFALDSRIYAFVARISSMAWVDIPDASRRATSQLAELGIVETDPVTAFTPYSGPGFIGDFIDLVSVRDPLVLNCFSTAHCPLRCRYCHADDLMGASRRESEDGAGAGNVGVLVSAALEIKSMVAVITGGDPLTRLDRAEPMIRGLGSSRSIVVDTSGVGDVSSLARLAKVAADVGAHVRVSIDSFSPVVQTRVRPVNGKYARGMNSYASAVLACRMMLEAGVAVSVQSVVSNANDGLDHLRKTRDFIISLGVQNWVLHVTAEAGLARKLERSRRDSGRRSGGILPHPNGMGTLASLVDETVSSRLPIDLRVTDNNPTPNSVLLLGSDGNLYTEGMGHRGKVQIATPRSLAGFPDPAWAQYWDRQGHSRRYLNWPSRDLHARGFRQSCIQLGEVSVP